MGESSRNILLVLILYDWRQDNNNDGYRLKLTTAGKEDRDGIDFTVVATGAVTFRSHERVDIGVCLRNIGIPNKALSLNVLIFCMDVTNMMKQEYFRVFFVDTNFPL